MTLLTYDRAGVPGMPGDAGLPLIGYTLQLAQGSLLTGDGRYEKYGPVSWSRALGINAVHAMGPDACEEVLRNRDQAYANGPGWSFMIGPFFHGGLMLMDFDEHHRHRRIMQSAFTAERLAGYLGPMNETIAAGLRQWPRTGTMHFHRRIKQLTLDVATRTFSGTPLGPQTDRVNAAFTDTVAATTAAIRVPIPGLRWSNGLRGRHVLEQYLTPNVAAKRAGDGNDLFSALCHAVGPDGERFTDSEIVDHMIFLLMAAHDTATATMTTMTYYLARHPQWQERCREESRALGVDAISYADLDKLTSLDLVMKEAMRIITPVPAVMRRTVKDTELLGYRIPADTQVGVMLWHLHHMPELWSNPYRFDPERFAEPRREDKAHRHAYMPFGHGVHKCIGMYFGGMEIKAAMHQMLLRQRWSVEPNYRMPTELRPLPRPSDGLPIRVASA
ncbi:cytochrome P450 [Nocardia aurantiaca]|uniref:Cytochrome P450 n=1 Tax=Nocardia aurantiaca TaxID=2675850 RepID=A0A6I3KUK3_9NOCA|nr:cytochrome P450 [Nocardia aurantiaca]MTE13061.1 cytochrome P450 [Nocardia aurantiaca]